MEREGFEPSHGMAPPNRLAICPLHHLSIAPECKVVAKRGEGNKMQNYLTKTTLGDMLFFYSSYSREKTNLIGDGSQFGFSFI